MIDSTRISLDLSLYTRSMTVEPKIWNNKGGFSKCEIVFDTHLYFVGYTKTSLQLISSLTRDF